MAENIKQVKIGSTTYDIVSDKTALYYVPTLTVKQTGSSTSGAYLASKWAVANVEGITTPRDGMSIAIRTPAVGYSGGILLSIDNGTTYYPIVRNVNTLVTTTYAAGSTVIVTFNATQTASPYTSAGATSSIKGCWQTADYDANTKNSAGTSNKVDTKMYLVGATSQTSSGTTTYTNTKAYIGTDNCLYSNGAKVLTALPTHNHDDRYYTESEIDDKFLEFEEGVSGVIYELAEQTAGVAEALSSKADMTYVGNISNTVDNISNSLKQHISEDDIHRKFSAGSGIVFQESDGKTYININALYLKEITLITVEDIDEICGTSIQVANLSEVEF